MQVSELIQKLQGLDANAHVICYCEDDGEPIPISEIDDVSQQWVVPSRDEQGKPRLRFERSSDSVKWVILGLTHDD